MLARLGAVQRRRPRNPRPRSVHCGLGNMCVDVSLSCCSRADLQPSTLLNPDMLSPQAAAQAEALRKAQAEAEAQQKVRSSHLCVSIVPAIVYPAPFLTHTRTCSQTRSHHCAVGGS